MHEPISRDQLVKALNKFDNRDVIVHIGYNYYDIIGFWEKENEIVLKLKATNKRNNIDDDLIS